MLVYRICQEKYADDLSGEGAALFGGRWNFPKTRALYTSTNPSLCLLEMLVHLPNYQIDIPFILVTLEVPESKFPKLDIKSLKTGWDSFASLDISRSISTKVFQTEKCLGLLTPSVVMNLDFNLVLDPLHPDFSKVRLVEKLPYKLEERFIK
jgi:RES domain-containing protein